MFGLIDAEIKILCKTNIISDYEHINVDNGNDNNNNNNNNNKIIIIMIIIMAIIIKVIVIIVIIMIIVKLADAVYFGNFLLFLAYISSKKNEVVRFFVSDHGSS